jgi:hypothetical protein
MKLIRKRILLKAFAVFFLLEIITSIMAPAVSWALTSGPTAPEATSFEPVDTTDMVNLNTGDFNYTMPLLEVPGPGGGYPLSLSYHAGIMPNEDASWVGLGWTINVGAITRNVNGFADDHSNVTDLSRHYWAGGEMTTYSVGLTLGAAGTPMSMSVGASISHDTYQGRGVGMNMSYGGGTGLQIGGDESPFGMGVGFSLSSGTDGYGNYYNSVGAGISLGWQGKNSNIGMSLGAGVSTNFKSVSTGYDASLSLSRAPSNGTTMSSGARGSASLSVGSGMTFSSNSKSGMMSTNSHGWSVPIPVWYGISITLGYRYQRYWIDQTEATTVFGVLNYPQHPGSGRFHPTNFDRKNYDTYSLVDPKLPGGIVDNPDPDKTMGGSFPNYDDYQVHAQGIFGAMRPYYFQKHLYQRNNYKGDDDKYYNTIDFDLVSGAITEEDNRSAAFRFVNDFSNRFEYTAPVMGHSASGDGHMQYNFSNAGVKNGEDGVATYSSNNIQGSRGINWFTNYEITSGAQRVKDAGFVDTRATGFSRTEAPNGASVGKQIGGFTIVNESGVKYHFALPAYSYQEYSYSENIEGTENYNEYYKKQPYAYTWFLTAVTGPDYVDRGANSSDGDGILNEYDWGYWVEFDYGKWTSEYTWRNPSEGKEPDLDEKFQNFSEGKKEIYYLDAIRTKTHTALFVKDIRHDGKGAVYALRNVNDRADGDGVRGKDNVQEATKNGGFIPIGGTAAVDRRYLGSWGDLDQEGSITYISRPTSVMKLKQILLMQNSDMPAALDKSRGQAYEQRYSYPWQVTKNVRQCTLCQNADFSDLVFDHHLYGNVFDVYDAANANLTSKALRVVQLDTDESLCPGTANSFDYTLVNTASPPTNSSSYAKKGKLTLKALQFLGKGGAAFMPPTKFGYDVDYTGTVKLSHDGLAYYFNLTGSRFVVGDVLRLERKGEVRYWRIWHISNGKHRLRRIYGPAWPSLEPHTFQLTKNPPYNKDAYDVWGMYKSDYEGGNQNLDRLPSESSARNVDAWSLRGVTAVTGSTIKIDYESDNYTMPELYTRNMLSVTAMELIPENKNVRFTFEDTGIDLTEIRDLIGNSKLELLVAKDMYYNGNANEIGCDGRPFGKGSLMGSKYFEKSRVISPSKLVELSGRRMEIHDPAFFDELYNDADDWYYDSDCFTGGGAIDPKILLKKASLVAGNLYLSGNITTYGGGVRTKKISVIDLDGIVTSTSYTYQNGRTSYEPFTFGRVTFNFGNYENGTSPRESNTWAAEVTRIENGKKAYRRTAYKNFSNLLSNAVEVPAPGVLYGRVIVRNEASDGTESKTMTVRQEYEFETFTDDLVDIQYTENDSTGYTSDKVYNGGIHYNEIRTRKVTLRDYSSRVGNLKKIATYNANNEKLTETVSHYLHDGIVAELQEDGYNGPDVRQKANTDIYEPRLYDQYSNQGVMEETFTDAHLLRKTGDMFKVQATVTKREQYPSIQTGSTTINYKTGVTVSSKVLAFDYYSAQPVKTLSTDGYGNAYIQETLPAFRKYTAMQQAVNGGKNMLTQEAASVTYKVDPNNVATKLGVIAASIQTWSDQIKSLSVQQPISDATAQPGIWRKQTSYTFVGSERNIQQTDGSYKIVDFSPGFNTWVASSVIDPTVWQRAAEITLYDVNSHALEAKDLNDDFASTRMSYDLTRVTATAANASFQEMGYANVEDSPAGGAFGSDVRVVGSNFTTSAHTGKRALIAAAGATAFVFPMATKARTYRVSFWSKHPDAFVKYKYNDTGVEELVAVENKGKAGSWYLLEADFTAAASASVNVWCGAGAQQTSFDDFRVCPIDAAMTSYVYNTWGELSHILGADNLFTEYVYDSGGRLVRVNREVLGTGTIKVSETKYHYANQ